MKFVKKLLLALLISLPLVSAAQQLVPTITISPDVYYPFEEILYVEGMAPPNAHVELRLQKTGARPLSYTLNAQPNGEWALAEKIPLTAGEWEARVRLLEGDLPGPWSNPRVFSVVISGFTVAGIKIKYATLALVILALVLVGGIGIIFFSLRISRLKSALMSKEVREAQASVRSGLDVLRHEIFSELKLLNSSRRLSAEKLARKEHLMQELERIEREISREINDIGSRVN